MSNDKKAQAKKIYDSMIEALKKKEWNFRESNNEDLVIYSSYQGDDIPIEFIVKIDEDRQVLQFLSMLPFTFAEDKRVDAAIAVCVVNYMLVNGSFDYNFETGKILFRLTTCFVDSQIGEEFFMDMLATALITTDEYNDKFLMLSKGVVSLDQFIANENN